MKPRAGLVAGFAFVATAAWVGCGSDTLVGGGCREGLDECSLKCVDLRRDPRNCGACGRACAAGVACSAGVCGGVEGGIADGGGDDGSLADGFAGDGRPGDGSGGVGDGTGGEGGGCTPPFDTPNQCGDCFTKCVEPTPVCGLQGTFKCLSRCEAPLEACGLDCVNKFSDDKNCGMCGRVCASGICQAGMCVGKGFGHQVVIGMDFSDTTLSQDSDQVKMLGNAVFQSSSANVRVLTYQEFADAATVARIRAWLTGTATARGRMVNFTNSSGWSALPEELAVARFEVLLVFDQVAAPVDQMATVGTLCNDAMNAYAKGGGIIVALDGGSVGRMRDFLTNGGLLPVTNESDVTGTQLTVAAPTDAVGLNLLNVVAAKKSTVAFTTTQKADALHVFVVKDSSGMLPVVVHSVPAQ